MGEIAAERGDDPGSTATGLTPPPEVAGPQQEGREPALDEGVGRDLAEWSDAGLSDTDVEVEEEADEESAGSSAKVVSDEGAGDSTLEEEFEHAVEVEIPIGDESDSDPLAESASGERIAVEVLPDEQRGIADAGEDAAAPDLGDDDDTEDVVEVAGGGDAASFDLAAELSEALDGDEGSSSGNLGAGAEDDGFAAVFHEFKKGVSKALSEADHETHYDLGIAYREMGLLDDAIGEFQLAMGSPSRRVDSLHMLGICSHELDRAEEAVVHLQSALEAPEVTDGQAMAIRFELGLAFESIGQIDAAREAWTIVAAADPSFCEVEKHLAALEDAKSEREPDAGFESFNDLFEAEDEAPEADEEGEGEPVASHESFEDLIAEANEPLLEDDSGFGGPGDTASAPQAPAPPRPQPGAPRRRKKKISFV